MKEVTKCVTVGAAIGVSLRTSRKSRGGGKEKRRRGGAGGSVADGKETGFRKREN